MPLGMQVWDASGNLIVDTATYMGRILGTVSTGTSNGSVTNAGFATGQPWWFITRKTSSAYMYTPKITISGNTLSWQFESGTYANKADCLITYGVY